MSLNLPAAAGGDVRRIQTLLVNLDLKDIHKLDSYAHNDRFNRDAEYGIAGLKCKTLRSV